MSSLAPGTALQPQESVSAGAGAGAETALPLPALLLGAPALLGLALALVLVALVSWRRRQRRLSSPGLPEARDIEQDGKFRPRLGDPGGTHCPVEEGPAPGVGGGLKGKTGF